MHFLLNLISVAFEVVYLFVLVHVVLSWFRVDRNNKIIQLIDQVVDPMLKIVRRKMPKTGMIDLSPLVLLLGLHIMKVVVFEIITAL